MPDLSGWSETKLLQLIDDVLHRSMVDPEFRHLALVSPTAAAALLSDRALPPTFQPHFVESSSLGTQTANSAYILPDMISADGLLNDLELEAVAGGSCFLTNCMITNCMITNCMITNCNITVIAGGE